MVPLSILVPITQRFMSLGAPQPATMHQGKNCSLLLWENRLHGAYRFVGALPKLRGSTPIPGSTELARSYEPSVEKRLSSYYLGVSLGFQSILYVAFNQP